MKNLTIGVLYLFISVVALIAQPKAGNGVIYGVIIDSVAKAPLPYATVAVLDAKSGKVLDGLSTKNDGIFMFDGLPYMPFKIKCTFIGYKSYLSDDIVLTKENHNVNLKQIMLQAMEIGSEAVVVTGNREQVQYKLDKKIINISENPAAKGGRLIDALQTIPSINTDLEGNITVRGSANFQVLIDGKPSAQNGNQALKSIPADAVENVELITNPSAKYDPDGTVGIVNIVLRKASLDGFNGMLNANLGNRDKYSAEGLFNYRVDDLNIYSGLEYHDFTQKMDINMSRELYSKNNIIDYYSPVINRIEFDKALDFKIGLEYNISPTDYISFSTEYLDLDYKRDYPSKIKEWSNYSPNSKYYLNSDIYTVIGSYTTINAFYQKQFSQEGHQLNALWNSIIWDGGGVEKMQKAITDNNFNINDERPNKHQSDADSRSFMMVFKTDYSLPIEKDYKLEAGYNFDYTQDYSDYLYQDYNYLSSDWERNTIYSNDTKYYHTINAIYCTFAGSLFDLNYQIGLRGEYFNRRLNQETTNEYYNYKKFNLFPTFHLSAALSETTQIQASYSKRVQRPNVYLLNPFPDYSDDYILSIGNPKLMPEFTDSYELNLQQNFDNLFFVVQGYYRRTNNSITRIWRTNAANQIKLSYENVSENQMMGAEISANWNIFKGFRLSLNANIYRLSITNDASSVEESNSGNAIDGNMVILYNLFNNTQLQFNSFYIGAKYTTDGEVKQSYSFGFAVKQFLFDRKLTVFLSGRNIFNTLKYDNINQRENYKAVGIVYPESRSIFLGFSFNINNFENKTRPEDTIERNTVGGQQGIY